MIIVVKDINLLNYFMPHLEKLIEKFVRKSKMDYTVEDVKGLLQKRLYDPNLLLLVNIDKQYIPNAYSIIQLGCEIITNKTSAHFFQVCSMSPDMSLNQLYNEAIKLLKQIGVQQISFSTKRNASAFKKILKLPNYEQYIILQSEVN